MKIASLFLLLFLFTSLQAQNPKTQGEQPRTVQARTDPFQSGIAVSDSGVKRLILWLDEIEVQLNAEIPRKGMAIQTSNLNMSKSNINKAKGPVKNVSIALEKLKSSDLATRRASLADLHKVLADLESPMTELYNSILNLGESYSAKAAELKTRHDTVKNSIGNIR